MIADIDLLAKGALLGFSVSAPIGPVGILCIRRTLSHGPGGGVAVGLGAASADVIYATLAATGLTALSNTLVAYQTHLRFVAAGILLAIAYRAVTGGPEAGEPDAGGRHAVSGYATGLLLLITNPVTILVFAGVFAGLGLTAAGGSAGAAAAIVLGVFLGAQIWWLTLTGAVTALRHRLGGAALRRVNLASGLLLAGFGLAMLWSAAT